MDEYGDPKINTELTKIGDPNPLFTLSLTPTIGFNNKYFLSLWLEYRHGGDRWNGTQAFMDGKPFGVGEDYIEKAYFLRLSNIQFRYVHKFKNNFLESLTVGLSGKNLFLVTQYKGVDPASSLFGYDLGYGLDLFNTPTPCSYSIAITLRY